MNANVHYANLPLNSSLALIPVLLAYAMLWVYRLRIHRAVRLPLLTVLSVAWLAFLPNTCYLLSQWRHFLFTVDAQNLYLQSQFNKTALMTLMAMSMFYLAYSGFGIVAFALAVRPVERIVRDQGVSIWFWGLPFFTALSLGVYLGLVLRFNSWDLIHQPAAVWAHTVALGGRPVMAMFIVGFGVFLWALYESVDIWIDGIAERWSALTGRRIHLGPN